MARKLIRSGSSLTANRHCIDWSPQCKSNVPIATKSQQPYRKPCWGGFTCAPIATGFYVSISGRRSACCGGRLPPPGMRRPIAGAGNPMNGSRTPSIFGRFGPVLCAALMVGATVRAAPSDADPETREVLAEWVVAGHAPAAHDHPYAQPASKEDLPRLADLFKAMAASPWVMVCNLERDFTELDGSVSAGALSRVDRSTTRRYLTAALLNATRAEAERLSDGRRIPASVSATYGNPRVPHAGNRLRRTATSDRQTGNIDQAR